MRPQFWSDLFRGFAFAVAFAGLIALAVFMAQQHGGMG